jgi:hypothetical protein
VFYIKESIIIDCWHTVVWNDKLLFESIDGRINFDSWGTVDDLVVGLSILNIEMYSCKRAQPSISLLTRDDLRPIAFVSSMFVFPSSNTPSFLVSFYCYAMRTCANHDNRFNWCRQTLASIDYIINTNRVTPHFLYALFFLSLLSRH